MLKLDNVVKTYIGGGETVHALRGVSVAFRQSEFTSILGPSGCGKTTLLNIIGGLDRYDSGDLVINGKSTKEFVSADWDAYRNHNIGFIFQSYHLIPHLNVLQNVELALTLSGVPKKERRDRAVDALKKVGLGDQINKMPNQMSGGQMQRVSIARALVNNPDIILADEPTGALDTNTSIQIMELLAEISKTKLVIMVTHNPELAKNYSTRIISLLDGQIVGDTNPYNIMDNKEEEPIAPEEPEERPILITKGDKKYNKKKPKVRSLGKKIKEGKRTYMPFWTAISLSFRNLLTKKVRTILVAVAGSIGIIGVGLVFAIQNGFNAYIDDLEKESLAGFPVIVAPITYNADIVEKYMNEYTQSISSSIGDENTNNQTTEKSTAFPNDGRVIISEKKQTKVSSDASATATGTNEIINTLVDNMSNIVSKLTVTNVIDNRFINYCNSNIANKCATISYVYDLDMHLESLSSGKPYLISTSDINWSELCGGDTYVNSNYDLLAGTLPKNDNEIVVVLDKYNRISSNVITALGLNAKGSYTVDDLLVGDDCPIKLLSNDGYYEYVESDNKFIVVSGEEKLNEVYHNDDLAEGLKVVGVLRIKKNADNEIIYSGLAYPNSLLEKAFKNAKESQIVKVQLENKAQTGSASKTIDVFTGKKFDGGSFIEKFMKISDAETQYETRLRQLGYSRTPSLIYLFPSSFNDKTQLKAQIDAYNEELKNEADLAFNDAKALDSSLTREAWDKTYSDNYKKIVYTDMAEMATETVSSMINIISIVLVCFAGISLIVSSLMIGIITYISVVERTKEIGILRSIGARKIDIGNVFNAETIIIGMSSGVIGILVTYLLSIPINIIIQNFAGISANIASLSPLYAIMLVAVSIFLTFISGLIPSIAASKRDPVKSLRSE